MTVDLSKAKAGDTVTIILGKSDAKALRNKEAFWVYHDEIKSIETPPFDWATVKPGMAFKTKLYGTRRYVGPSLVDKGYMVFQTLERGVSNIYVTLDNDAELTRAPEHDIEVPS